MKFYVSVAVLFLLSSCFKLRDVSGIFKSQKKAVVEKDCVKLSTKDSVTIEEIKQIMKNVGVGTRGKKEESEQQ